ncbi:PREDICTED: extra-large guanine nucleotide-binding protein 1-like isoform X2 [Lupinus angustifolius]|uniref:extra-large guanine nucleotide-binding protein 1-like isoform X2 n=1 Tax=Lupinus angustifolius TaxID=3871 RepID=UPI00092E58FD|nr:PREDICTED: extra-large guanine nucleotide-binding protein 1-like isoform X2 [Lupinus angustifolius]
MALLLKKLRPVVSSSSVHDDSSDYSVEYSFAEEYKGPPLSHSIPQVHPFKLDQIPIANIASFRHGHFSVPVIQPFSKKTNTTLSVHDDKQQHNTGFHDENEMNPISTNSNTTESGSGSGSGSSSLSVSCEIFPCREEDNEIENNISSSPRHENRHSIVTFRDPESNCAIHDEGIVDYEGGSGSNSGSSTPDHVRVKPHAVRNGQKGSCYRCLKGYRLTEREVCIVCSAKYCRNCVLRAMGSMPQGRKCVTCIGYRIDENKRKSLGKFSRMLKHLLSSLEVKQIMNAEMVCEANQIPPEKILVNADPLDWDQLMLLLRCANPPKGLKPGCYWYDRTSGFWGKEGQRPSQIISPHLDIGGRLLINASGGKTNVIVNGRLVSKEELLILKWAGVPCEGNPDFWMTADGSYMEVGQKNIKGRIWDKVGTKLACAILSLPVPSNSATPSGEEENTNKVRPDNLPMKMLYKFLLVGSVKSGTSTIFKQGKLLYNVPFSESEHQDIKLVIQTNLFTYIAILLEERENFEEESLLENRKRQHLNESTSSGNEGEIDTTIYSISSRLKGLSDWLVKCMVAGNLAAIFPAATREYAPLVEELWKDPAIQATYNRRNELKMLPRSASYFLDRAVEISKIDYQPSNMDILYAGGITLSNSLASMEFSFPVSRAEDSLDAEFKHDPSLRYQIIRVHPTSLGENCKWLDMFEDTDTVLFSVALTDYDEYTIDSNGVATNKMLAAKNLFEKIITHKAFNNKKFLLILTKFDLLEEKVETIPLTRCEWFSDFNPVISHNEKTSSSSSSRSSIVNNTNSPPLAQRAFQYIAMKFKRLFRSVTERKLFVSLVNGLEPDTVDEAVRYAREVSVWEKWDPSFKNEKSEITTTTIDPEGSSS